VDEFSKAHLTIIQLNRDRTDAAFARNGVAMHLDSRSQSMQGENIVKY
jgi:hypothetical protein